MQALPRGVLLTPAQAAQFLGVSRPRIDQLRLNGQLKAVGERQKWLYEPEVLEAFLQNPPCKMQPKGRRSGRKPKAPSATPQELPPLEAQTFVVAGDGPITKLPTVTFAPPPPPPTEKQVPSGLEEYAEFLNQDGSFNMERCRSWAEFEKARKLQVERLAAEGKYVQESEIAPAWQKTLISINRSVMAIPNRMKADNPDMTLNEVAQLEKLCREALKTAAAEVEELSNAD